MEIDSYATPDAQALLGAGERRLAMRRRDRRQLVVHTMAAGLFLITAIALSILAPWHRPLSWLNLALVMAIWVAVERIRFPVAGGWTWPTMLAFVPALFLLPLGLVPVVGMCAILLRRGSDLLRGRVPLSTLPVPIADGWFTVGPTLVLAFAGGRHFSWSQWPIYLGALAAQLACDLASSVGRCWIGEGVSPRIQLPLLSWVYLVDAALAPLGLAVAACAVRTPPLVLLALSPLVMLWLFARERKQRLDDTLALSSAYHGTALLLGDIVEADDHYTGMHSREVVALSVAVAEKLRLDSAARRTVEFAALLHDVGKIRIPKEIINKPGPLTDAEWAMVHRHPLDGEEMLQLVGGTLASVGQVVRATHERYDGQGYPDGSAGEAIPIEARIICACDAYSAMTTERPYRGAMSTGKALAELRRCAATQFDPHVVDCIEALLVPRTAPESSWLDLLGSAPPVSPATEQLLDSLRRHPGQEEAADGAGATESQAQPVSTEPSGILSGSSA